jgi:hypothetical protein
MLQGCALRRGEQIAAFSPRVAYMGLDAQQFSKSLTNVLVVLVISAAPSTPLTVSSRNGVTRWRLRGSPASNFPSFQRICLTAKHQSS